VAEEVNHLAFAGNSVGKLLVKLLEKVLVKLLVKLLEKLLVKLLVNLLEKLFFSSGKIILTS